MTLEQIIHEAMQLPSAQRAQVVDRLLATLGQEEDFEISPAWRSEIAKRVAAVESGEMKTIDADVVFERMRGMLRK
ncbi:MAG: addiction module protein [Phycisphaerales bacterium JB063]